jgi:curved DNA-binding protein CbpA
MKGTVAQRSPFDLLSEIQRRQASGILRLQKGETVRQIFIDAGVMIRFAASTLPAESMTSLFKAKGGITDDQARAAAAAKAGHELLGTTLVRLGFMSRQTLTDLTEEHIRHVLGGAAALTEGEYEFQQGALPFREQLDGGLATAEALLEWARSIPDVEWIRRRLGSPDARVRLSNRPPEAYQQVPLNPSEGYTMSRVDGTATLREICIVSPMGEETTLRALFGLAMAGILEVPDTAAAAPAPAAPGGRAPRPAAPGAVAPQAPRPQTAPPRPAAAAPAPPAIAAPAPAAAPRGAAPTAAPATPKGATAPRAPSSTAAGRPAGARPHPGVAPGRTPGNGGAPRSAPPRKVTAVKERVRPATSPDLESEMLQRFERMRDQDLYQVLEVPGTAPADDVRRAYYGLAKRFHPDKFTREDFKAKAEKVFGHITEAYSTLSHPEARKKYDEDQAMRRTPKPQEKAADGHELARLNFKHGKDQYDRGRFGEALSFFQNACDQDPSKAEYFYYLAMTQSRNPRWKKDAEVNFLKALEIDPSNAEYYAHLGSLYLKGGLHAKAREMFKKALEWDPAHAVALEGLAAEDGRKGVFGMFKK